MNLMMAALMLMGGQDDAARTIGTQKVSVDFRETSLSDAIDFFRDVTGLNLVVSAGVDDARVTLKLTDVSVRSALKLMLHPLDLTLTSREGVLVIVPRAEAKRRMTTRVYDVRDLLQQIVDYPAPKMELSTVPAQVSVIVTIDPEPRAGIDESFILELVKNHTSGWEGDASVSLVNGLLVVVQSKAGHEEVSNLLGRMRMFK
jgi:type II secretory pathway component GspD/PulD (secretin)